MSAADRGGHWALVGLLGVLGRRFGEGWRALPAGARRRWTRTVAIGFLLVLLLITVMEWGGRALAEDGILGWEAGVLRWIERDAGISFSTGVWIQTLGTDLTLIMLTLVTAGIAAWLRQPLRALTILAAYALLDPIIRVGWLMWDRARPTIILDGAASPGFASFPSGHTAKSLALYGILTFLWARASGSALERALAGFALAGVVALVMLGRLRMGVHWPSDVIAGALLGAVWLAVLVAALRAAGRG